jgi:hypothetical protein
MPLSLRTGRGVGVRVFEVPGVKVCDGQGDLSRWQRADGQLRPPLKKTHLLRGRLAG